MEMVMLESNLNKRRERISFENGITSMSLVPYRQRENLKLFPTRLQLFVSPALHIHQRSAWGTAYSQDSFLSCTQQVDYV